MPDKYNGLSTNSIIADLPYGITTFSVRPGLKPSDPPAELLDYATYIVFKGPNYTIAICIDVLSTLAIWRTNGNGEWIKH